MLKNCLNGLLIIFLMASYLNRGLFVDAAEINFAPSNNVTHKGSDINSALELILELTGFGTNDIDEDGDNPETYAMISFTQPFVYQEFAQTLEQNNLFPKEIKKDFHIFSDIIYSQSVYRQD